jgi:hypothetical protein
MASLTFCPVAIFDDTLAYDSYNAQAGVLMPNPIGWLAIAVAVVAVEAFPERDPTNDDAYIEVFGYISAADDRAEADTTDAFTDESAAETDVAASSSVPYDTSFLMESIDTEDPNSA